MRTPPIWYLVASPAGDLPVDPCRLNYPLEADPLRTPYQVYFHAISDFLSREDFRSLTEAISEEHGTDFPLSKLNEIIVRTEKHGALCHPSSIEVLTTNKRIKFGLDVAVTDRGKDSLLKEFELLTVLHHKFNLPYLPRPYCVKEIDSMVFLLEEWFEGYHEFHLSLNHDGAQQIKLWEYGRGDRFLPPGQSFEIYRQAARILTLFYDLKDFRLIYPWHHSAGDFIVKVSDRSQINVRLTTVRGYEPFMGRDIEDMINPAVALFYFLLHLSVQMRLDRLDGVGDPVWADDFCVDATLRGFLQGLELKKDFRDCCGSRTDFTKLLQSFSRNDLGVTFESIIEQYDGTKDFPLIKRYLDGHIEKLYLTLQNFP
jgi:hypothetical protein